MIRRPPRSTRVRSSAASDVYKRQVTALPVDIKERGADTPGPIYHMTSTHTADPLSLSLAACVHERIMRRRVTALLLRKLRVQIGHHSSYPRQELPKTLSRSG